MDISLPTDCGNAPRIAIVSDFVADWARGDASDVSEQLAPDATWTLVGGAAFTGGEASSRTGPGFAPDRLVVSSVITHGRLASADGVVEAGTSRTHFSFALRFASTSKTAKIRDVRAYLIAAD